MSSQKRPSRKTKYHHGNLREVLLEAARDLISEVGVDAFTLRELARRIGVSQAAPYHHFSDKSQLLRHLASHAFEQLTQRMIAAKSTSSDPLEVLSATGMAYVHFALTHPAEFRFMFRHELNAPGDDDSQLEQVGARAFQVLEDSIRTCQETGVFANSSTQVQVMAAWSIVHGFACLLVDGPEREPFTRADTEPLGRALIQTLIYGLHLRPE